MTRAWVEVIALMVGVGSLLWVICDDAMFWLHGGRLDAECVGCQRHFVIPGCPIHDPEQRRTPLAENSEAVQTTREKGSSFVA